MPLVELFGQARALAGTSSVEVEAGTVAQALAALAVQFPSLVGPVLDLDGGVTPAYTLNLDGKRFLRDLDELLQPDDRLLIFSTLSGG